MSVNWTSLASTQLRDIRRVTDGVVVYSIGPDRTDNQGTLNRAWSPPGGTDIGMQLWESEQTLASGPHATVVLL
jgi:hypothetical protein